MSKEGIPQELDKAVIIKFIKIEEVWGVLQDKAVCAWSTFN